MFFLRKRLFSGTTTRCFILLDEAGICRALRHSAQAPQGPDWVEVEDASLHWLGHKLPNGLSDRAAIAANHAGKAVAA